MESTRWNSKEIILSLRALVETFRRDQAKQSPVSKEKIATAEQRRLAMT
jgi:hypothetical protein